MDFLIVLIGPAIFIWFIVYVWRKFTSGYKMGFGPESYENQDDDLDYSAYSVKDRLITPTEERFFRAIQAVLPYGYYCFPQVNLATFIYKNDGSKYRNELFRNVDFLITNSDYLPVLAVEINDETHKRKDRQYRDIKVKNILHEAGIPLLVLWAELGVNDEYIKERINSYLFR